MFLASITKFFFIFHSDYDIIRSYFIIKRPIKSLYTYPILFLSVKIHLLNHRKFLKSSWSVVSKKVEFAEASWISTASQYSEDLSGCVQATMENRKTIDYLKITFFFFFFFLKNLLYLLLIYLKFFFFFFFFLYN